MSHSSKRESARRTLIGWSFSGPYVVLLLLFGLVPTVFSIWESLNSVTKPGAITVSNFTDVFNDFRFWPAVGDVALFMVIWIPLMVGGTLILALMIHEKANRLSGAMRLIYFLPGAVTGSAAVLLWYFMLSPELSPFRPILHAMGWHTNNDMFTSAHLAPIFAIVAFMTGVGQWILIMFGALQSVPHEVIEAAKIDGAGPVRTAVSIKLPLISKYIAYMAILSMTAALQVFVEPQLFNSITQAGSTWWSLNQLGYTFAFAQGNFGMAATVSVVLLIVSALGAMFLVFRTDFFQTEVDS